MRGAASGDRARPFARQERGAAGSLAGGEARICPAPGGHMYYRRVGDGPGLILLHGLGGGSGYWEALVRDLRAQHTCVAPDLLGFGRSAWPALDYTPDAHVAALRAVLADAAVAPPYDVIGHSMGGVLAIDLARSLPGGVRTLTLLCAPYPRPTPVTAQQLWRRGAAPPGSVAALRQQRRMALVAWLWRRLVTIYPPRGYPRAAVWDYLSYSMWAYLDTAARVLNGRDLTQEADMVRDLPVLLLYGAQDRQVPLAAAHGYQQLFSQSGLRVFPTATNS